MLYPVGFHPPPPHPYPLPRWGRGRNDARSLVPSPPLGETVRMRGFWLSVQSHTPMKPSRFTFSRHPRFKRCVSAPVPRPFDFGFTARRPLVPLSAACLFLNKDSAEVIDLIEQGKLRWAFDIRSARAAKN